MRETLLSLRTRRTSLVLILSDLQDERIEANNARKAEIKKEMTQYSAKLNRVSDDIAIVSGTVSALEEQWNKKNVSNKPVTVLGG